MPASKVISMVTKCGWIYVFQGLFLNRLAMVSRNWGVAISFLILAGIFSGEFLALLSSSRARRAKKL